MNFSKVQIRSIGHFLVALAMVIVLVVSFTTPLGFLPSLSELLDPMDGVLVGVASEANHPSEEVVMVTGLTHDVEVVRDYLGIPHLYAETEKDMAYATGYVHAQDRLWQMDVQRRQFSGQLAEILGQEFLEEDKFFRSLGLVRVAEDICDAMGGNAGDQHLLNLLDAYASGINQYIAEKHPLPLEFALLGYEPRPWTAVDSVAFAKFMSFSLGYSTFDFKFQDLVQTFGATKAYELFPLTQPLQIPVVPTYGYFPMPDPFNLSTVAAAWSEELILKTNDLESSFTAILFNYSQEIQELTSGITTGFGPLGSPNIGSNNWVVGPEKSATGKPILANDMHLLWSLPPIWYQLSQHVSESELHLWGYSFVGTPFVVAGHNGYAAWGFTNAMNDVTDWYYYSTEGDKYLYNGSLHDYQKVDETIQVRGQSEVTIEVRSTVHGPIIPVKNTDLEVALSWVGIKDYKTELGERNIMKALYSFHHSASLEDFKSAVLEGAWDSPAQNIVYADVEGNIAMWVAGFFPIRSSGMDGRVPVNGSDPGNDWLGYVQPDEWPVSINPDQGYLASANQPAAGPDYPYYVGSPCAPGYRARAINYYLSTDNEVSVEDMKRYQQSNWDTSAVSFVPFLLNATQKEGTRAQSSLFTKAVTVLEDWTDYVMDKEKAAPIIYFRFLENFRELTFRDDYEEKGLAGGELPRPEVLEFMTRYNESVEWFDDVNTAEVENRDIMMVVALDQTLELLENEYGPNIDEWKWGKDHQASVEHLAGISSLSAEIRPHDGSYFTLNAAAGPIVRGGPSERAIYDLSNFSASLSQLPGGQSGNPVSPHYMDLLEDYFFEYNYYPMYYFNELKEFPSTIIENKLVLRRTTT